MKIRHFLRMARWARNPPSEGRVKLVFAIIAICLVVFAFEKVFGWPDWMTLGNTPKGRMTR
ncbi:hypothetical protein [Shimia aestuarii]|uniref:Uncharacterized protein n=1 Tax=Shimia aestuarii TaxID=254406 RepID=A0A1I4NHK0_9RHOB|nr:hypothetical protein [Shimia aestuarii]SFM15022.1 hypothetical protein SAMN04488042_104201 [Shimia aestuarii]